MNTHTPSLLALLLALAPLPTPAATLYTETFEKPTGLTYNFPVVDGYKSPLNDRVKAWSGNGVVALTFAAGLGENDGGGIKLAVATAGSDYAVLNVSLPLPTIKPGTLTVDQLKAMTFSFSTKGTETLKLSVAIHPSVKADWAVRLIGPDVVLSSKWNIVRFNFAKAKPEALAAVVQSYNIGDKAELTAAIYMKDFADWQPGDSFQVDNVKLETTAR
jgi:hypothetical protein